MKLSSLLFFLIGLSNHIISQVAWPEKLAITPEKTQFQKTSTHADVMNFMAAVQQLSSNVYVFSMGKSLEGRDIPVAVISNPTLTSGEQVKASGKTVLYIQGNIHAGEVEGKEAVMMLMRDIAAGSKRYWLDSLIIIFVPIYNTDANDRMQKGIRPSQEDSPLETGERESSEGYDLNRDGVKMEARETRALFSQVINPYDPHIFVDLHTTNGTWHAYSLTWAPSFHSAGEYSLFDYSYHKMLPTITDSCKQKYNLLMGPYGDYHLEEGWPPKNFYSYNHHPRYLVNMMGLRNRIGILSEAFAHERFYQRIHSTYSFMTEILEYAYHHASEIRNIIKQAEDSTKYKVTKSAGDIQKGMVYKMMPLHPLNNFISYDYAPFVDSLGTPKYYRTGKIVRFDKVMYHAKYEATKETTVPSGYIVPHEFGYIIDNLKLHGVTVQTLDKNKEYVGEQFVVDSLQHDAQMFQKHFSATAYGQYLNKHIKFKKGDYIISMNQPLSNLIFYLLEPESDDGLVHWNFFDSYFEKLKAEKKPLISPVFKYYER